MHGRRREGSVQLMRACMLVHCLPGAACTPCALEYGTTSCTYDAVAGRAGPVPKCLLVAQGPCWALHAGLLANAARLMAAGRGSDGIRPRPAWCMMHDAWYMMRCIVLPPARCAALPSPPPTSASAMSSRSATCAMPTTRRMQNAPMNATVSSHRPATNPACTAASAGSALAPSSAAPQHTAAHHSTRRVTPQHTQLLGLSPRRPPRKLQNMQAWYKETCTPSDPCRPTIAECGACSGKGALLDAVWIAPVQLRARARVWSGRGGASGRGAHAPMAGAPAA